MSDRLNDDVLKLILDELSSLEYYELFYIHIKRALLCLCRTSRRFRALAQPLVWRQVRIAGPKQLERLRASTATSVLGSHTVVYEIHTMYSHRIADALDVADLLPGVTKLRVSAAQAPLDVALLAQHHALEFLDLSGVVLDGPVAPTLRALKQLLIADSSASMSLLRQWLDPSRLPALRTVYVDRTTDLSSALPLQLADIIARPLLDQLDCIYTSRRHVDPQSALCDGIEPPILFLNHDPSAPLPRHSSPRLSLNSAWRALREIRTLIVQVNGRPTYEPPDVVLLPAHIAAHAASPAVYLREPFQQLEQASAAHRVRIVWESEAPPSFEGPPTLGFDDFWRYARELKAARTGAAGR